MWPPDPDPDADPEPVGRSPPGAPAPRLRALLPARAFLCSLKGRLLLAESGLSFITFVCYVASSASAFLTAPLLEFLLALFFLFADAMQLNDKWQGLCWPMMDFLRCVTAALIYFAISITAVAKYSDGASKAAGKRILTQTPIEGLPCPGNLSHAGLHSYTSDPLAGACGQGTGCVGMEVVTSQAAAGVAGGVGLLIAPW
ncbi:CKLF-like MARVEL transmembrane domain-containing protein 3 isoform X1 [Pteropus vampyrus]|uniref:CKLF-like MARVEL transmembrane domain-containing protein 3 isoform X1 n=1 Tax=Pteropus vampyrus TaxID=132908 RepID=A0A6P6BVT6_PTEVA|nr:CKLF-like MARVEL transmembrane domain-containing protein 3 isoform X1 [Pteropus vampyrus]